MGAHILEATEGWPKVVKLKGSEADAKCQGSRPREGSKHRSDKSSTRCYGPRSSLQAGGGQAAVAGVTSAQSGHVLGPEGMAEPWPSLQEQAQT